MMAVPALTSTKDLQVQCVLGEGQQSRIYLVTSVSLPSRPPFVLKVVPICPSSQAHTRSHVNQESKLMQELTHPGVIRLFHSFQDSQRLYLLLEFAPGGQLLSRIPANGLDIAAVQFYISEIVLVLDYLHRQSVIHRDLKPENVLIAADGHIKVTDFGAAKKVEGRTMSFCGTAEYLAPEVIMRKGHGKAVDWWTLGILLYELLVGKSPFQAAAPYAIYTSILTGTVFFPSHISAPAKSLISALLEKDAGCRLGTKGDASEVKAHNFFTSAAWKRLEERTECPPWVPTLRDTLDTSYFAEAAEPLFGF
jgi:protein kinase X